MSEFRLADCQVLLAPAGDASTTPLTPVTGAPAWSRSVPRICASLRASRTRTGRTVCAGAAPAAGTDTSCS